MPRFVVLLHEGSPRGTHYDLLLQTGDVLRAWALEQPPEAVADQPALALPDHRAAYLDYEGEISGGRGRVTRWDGGEYQPHRQSADELVVRLAGKRFTGRLRLWRISAPDQWHCQRLADS